MSFICKPEGYQKRHGLRKIFFCCHPADEGLFEEISDLLLDTMRRAGITECGV